MLQGHGDDIYRYGDVRINFSSNIYNHADLSGLKAFLRTRLDVIGQYPEPEPYTLEAAIACKHGVPKECVLVTNGATEAIYLIAQMLAVEGYNHYHIPQPTFNEYEDACRMFGMTESPDGILWLCNPNNPTGKVFPYTPAAFSPSSSPLTILDQSYEDFTLQPMMTAKEAVKRGDIIQIHSLTKTCAVPGLRLGYVVSAPSVIERLRRLLRPWSVNALAIEAGHWLIEHDFKAIKNMEAYLAETQRLRRSLNAIPGISVAPTDTCFMLAELVNSQGSPISTVFPTAFELKDYLIKKHRILIRDASNFRGLTPRHFRVSTQLPEENDELVQALCDITATARRQR